RYRLLRDENRSMSAMPRKRRLAVKASSVATGQQWTHALAAKNTFTRSSRRPRDGGLAEAERSVTRRESQCDRSTRRILIGTASLVGRRGAGARGLRARGEETPDQARRIKQRPRSASAEVNRSLRYELGRVRKRGRDDLGVRVGELRERV